MEWLEYINQIRAWSKSAWEMAINTGGPEYTGGSVERATDLQDLMSECLSAYDDAIEAIEGQYAGWRTIAREGFSRAKELESQGGDCSHAQLALETLDELISEDDNGSEP